MTKIVGVRFQRAGKIYYFDPADYDLDMAMHVIVETARGMEMGTVLIPPKEVEDDTIVAPLKPVIRVATDEDERMAAANKAREKEAFDICKEKILKHELEMKLVAAEYTFDGNKLLFYFTADGRVDFRELVKDLASVFRTRIELRQIGVRDETKMMGGIGICGRPLCCSTWLADFVPVSIKMAKEQSLSLNPTKISGVCGRLMCCLKNEQETYEYLNSRLPGVGDMVVAMDGTKGTVSSVNVLRQLVKVIVDNGDEKEMKEFPADELKFRPRHRKDTKLTEEELKELEGLEEELNETAPRRKDSNKRRENNGEEGRRDRRENGENNREEGRRDRRENGDYSREEGRRDRREGDGEENRRDYNKRDRHRDYKDKLESTGAEGQDNLTEAAETENQGRSQREGSRRDRRENNGEEARRDRRDRRRDYKDKSENAGAEGSAEQTDSSEAENPGRSQRENNRRDRRENNGEEGRRDYNRRDRRRDYRENRENTSAEGQAEAAEGSDNDDTSREENRNRFRSRRPRFNRSRQNNAGEQGGSNE